MTPHGEARRHGGESSELPKQHSEFIPLLLIQKKSHAPKVAPKFFCCPLWGVTWHGSCLWPPPSRWQTFCDKSLTSAATWSLVAARCKGHPSACVACLPRLVGRRMRGRAAPLPAGQGCLTPGNVGLIGPFHIRVHHFLFCGRSHSPLFPPADFQRAFLCRTCRTALQPQGFAGDRHVFPLSDMSDGLPPATGICQILPRLT